VNNQKYYPFERNNYYTGKVLSAGNLEAEQRYLNDKRRLVNHFVAGGGVVCGLDVVAVDTDTISVETGVAIDGWGREIVVNMPNVKKLSGLSGYREDSPYGNYWLYLSYEEKEDSGKEWINERYMMYLSDSRPDYEMDDTDFCYKHKEILFENNEVLIELDAPKYLEPSKPFFVEVKLRPLMENIHIQLNMKVYLECVRYRGRDVLEINFDSSKVWKNEDEYVLSYLCDAMNVADELGVFGVDGAGFKLECEGSEYKLAGPIKLESVISETSVSENVLSDYRACIMNYSENKGKADVCIAGIQVRNGRIFKIHRHGCENVIWSNDVLALENRILKDRLRILEMSYEPKGQAEEYLQQKDDDFRISSGEAVISFGIGGEAGKRFFSEEITHNLGLGNVAVTVSLKDMTDSCYVSGSSEVFDLESAIKAELAVKVNPESGTFVIGARLLESTSEYEAVIQWTAMMHKDDRIVGTERKIIIDNSLKSLRVMESAYYTVKFVNMEPVDVIWSVEDENGGTINENGYYTAPDSPGVYKIKVECAGEPEIFATAFIVIKS
jgi:hypothetical protein